MFANMKVEKWRSQQTMKIAKVIYKEIDRSYEHGTIDEAGLRTAARKLADMFVKDIPYFNREQFLKDCGVD